MIQEAIDKMLAMFSTPIALILIAISAYILWKIVVAYITEKKAGWENLLAEIKKINETLNGMSSQTARTNDHLDTLQGSHEELKGVVYDHGKRLGTTEKDVSHIKGHLKI